MLRTDRLLRPSSLDQDMVDERARVQLSVVNPNEVVIMDFDKLAQAKSN